MEFGAHADVGQQHAIMLDMQLLSIVRYTRTTVCVQEIHDNGILEYKCCGSLAGRFAKSPGNSAWVTSISKNP